MKVQKIIFTVTVLFCSLKAYGMDFSEYTLTEVRISGKKYDMYTDPAKFSLRVFFKDEKGVFLVGVSKTIDSLRDLEKVVRQARGIEENIAIEGKDGALLVDPIKASISHIRPGDNGSENSPYTIRVVDEKTADHSSSGNDCCIS